MILPKFKCIWASNRNTRKIFFWFSFLLNINEKKENEKKFPPFFNKKNFSYKFWQVYKKMGIDIKGLKYYANNERRVMQILV